jgi:hypothetical protein
MATWDTPGVYPAEFFGLFPPFPREDRMFVAMDFRETFRPRWENVIRPAIAAVRVNDVSQTAYRVDARIVGDSILTEILTGISRSRLIVADLTAISHEERIRSTGEVERVPLRNANVMYEVGLAHATRLPEEVLLFRSDRERLLFDVAQIRVNSYDPDGSPEAATAQLTQAAIEALRAVELRRHLAVERAAARLDAMSWLVLTEVLRADAAGVPHPRVQTMGDVLSNAGRLDAIHRLLDEGAIEGRLVPNDEAVRYHLTPFGTALVGHARSVLGTRS